MDEVAIFGEVRSRILTVNDQQVLIDRDVAELYGVETKEVNQAVKNNPDKFPPGYIIALDNAAKAELVKNFDRFDPLKHSSVPPSAFTEKGLYMMATILKSSKATQTTISIIETFAKLRELSKAINQLPDARDKSAQKSLMQKSGEILAEILDENSMETTGDETSIEINLAVMKIKRTIKREKKKN